MAENTAIEWCDHTFNPAIGCTQVSPGCDNCYAKTMMDDRYGRVKWNGPPIRTSESNWKQPLAWNRKAERDGVRRKVFCASLADVFDNQWPVEWRTDLWRVIRETPDLDWLLLTKRPQNIASMLPGPITTHPWPWSNVWLGTTVENQEEADRRIPHLLAVPAARRFLSCEPLLGAINLRDISLGNGVFLDALTGGHSAMMPIDSFHDVSSGKVTFPELPKRTTPIDWVICGGESGPNSRPMHPDWARSLRDQCQATGVPFFFKQWGEWAPIPHEETLPGRPQMVRSGDAFVTISGVWQAIGSDLSSALESASSAPMRRVGKKRAGALLDGREWREFPA